MAAPIRVLLVDDHTLFRSGIKALLLREPGFEVVGEAGDYGELRALMRSASCDVLVLDINLPDIEGFDVLAKLRQIDPEGYIVMLSGNGDRENVIRAIEQGAKGFVGKPFSPKKLTDYIFKSPWVQRLMPAETVS